MAGKAKSGKSVSSATGSPANGEPVYLLVGALRRAHGVHGEMVMEILTDFPERLTAGARVFVGESHAPMKIEQARQHSEGLLVHFAGLDSPEAAARYRNQSVYVSTADRPRLPEGQYYHHQLIDFDVVDENGRSLGRLDGIMQTGANDVYVVKRPTGAELLLPVIASVVLAIDTGQRQIRVRLLPGLVDDTDN